jgi:signal transduction histidine kinase
VIAGLLRVVGRVHAGRSLTLTSEPIAPASSFAGELQDLQEIVGNVLDNACAWARSEVRVSASTDRALRQLHIVVDDDGPGIDAARRDAVMARGARLDESVPGSGLGLAIVHELVAPRRHIPRRRRSAACASNSTCRRRRNALAETQAAGRSGYQ